MPYIIKKDLDACPISKPWAVANAITGDVRGRCHATEESAKQQQKALYAAMRKEAMKLGEGEYFLVPVENLFAEGDAPTVEDTTRWVQAFPYDTWDHPIYGKTTVTPEIASQYVKNFRDNVRGQDLAINYEHGEDKSKGNKAAGWIKDMEARGDGLFLKIDFTPTAIQELKDGEWKYFSSESFDTWTHPHTDEKYQFVITGGALTNKPWVKNMLPINFSEVLTEKELREVEKEFAEWSESYLNELPDSCFMYIESGGKKDSEDKTVPRTLRHLPYKDNNGKVDEAHVRRAIERSAQMVGLSETLKKSLQAKAERVLAGMKKMNQLPVEEQKVFLELLGKTGLDVVEFGESKEWEHSEPGISSPPPPRTDEDGSDDKGIREGWRRPDLPSGFPETDPVLDAGRGFNEKPKGGTRMAELSEKDVQTLMRMFEVDDETKLVEQAQLKFGELEELKRDAAVQDQEAKFAEQYPEMWDEHNKLMQQTRENEAKSFSESVKQIRRQDGYALKETKQGLTAKARADIEEVHRKFAEKKVTVEDFENVIKGIVNGGIIEFGERGASRSESDDGDTIPDFDGSTANGIAGARRLFGELVAKEIDSHSAEWGELDPTAKLMKASEEVAKKHPDLAETYRRTVPA